METVLEIPNRDGGSADRGCAAQFPVVDTAEECAWLASVKNELRTSTQYWRINTWTAEYRHDRVGDVDRKPS